MKHFFLMALCFPCLCCFGQSDKKTTVSAIGNFVVALKGLGYAEVGLGGELTASFFSKHRLQPIIEAHAARFKDNIFEYSPSSGKIAKTAVYTATVGPQYFISKKVAISVTIGTAWYKALDTDYHFGYGFKYSVSGFLGSKERLITKIFTVHVPTKEPANIYQGPIVYMGLAAGYRF
jgi:hypothetical protein